MSSLDTCRGRLTGCSGSGWSGPFGPSWNPVGWDPAMSGTPVVHSQLHSASCAREAEHERMEEQTIRHIASHYQLVRG